LRPGHLASLAPLCPVCRARGVESPVALFSTYLEEGEHIVEGALRCSEPGCLSEFPILDGIPLFLPNLRAYIAGSIDSISSRDDLSAATLSLLGDCCGPGSSFDITRQHLSAYAWDHYADLDPQEALVDLQSAVPADSQEGPGSVLRVLARGLNLIGDLPPGPILDLGCATGRTTFALAEATGCQVLGADLGFPLLRLASTVLRRAQVRYPRRRVGVVYDRRDFPVRLAGSEHVDFWGCDATALPFREGSFAAIVALNVLDCVPSPYDLLAALPRLLAPGGKALLTCPYDWSPGATPVEAWIGGHSQRGPTQGASEPALRALLTPGAHPSAISGLRIVAEEESVPWRVRLHERSAVFYRVDLLVVERVRSDERSGLTP
jgi:SAM-dependent methyltransferase/uncharacterized protein YbaR (Trm112 family)